MQSSGAEVRRLGLGIAIAAGFTLLGLWMIFADSVGGGLVFLFLTGLLSWCFAVAASRHHRSHQQRKYIYRDGIIATATIEKIRAVLTDHSGTRREMTSTDIVHEVQWSFIVGGHRFSGLANADSPKVAHLRVGDPIWVLVDPNNFSQSMEWPAGFAFAESTETTPQDEVKHVPQDRIEPF